MRIHHVGIATGDADEAASLFGDLLGAPLEHEEEFDGLRVAFLDCGNGYLELLEPLGDGGPVARHLERRGPGVHHLAFAVDDVEAALAAARDMGIDPVDGEPRPGAWGHEVAFLDPGSTGGVLVEFVA